MSISTGREESTAVLEAPTEYASDWAAPLGPSEQRRGEPIQQSQEETSATDPFDPQAYFDQWLDNVQAGPKKLIPENGEDDEGSQFFMESLPGSNCEVTFEGELHFNGLSIGNINSPEGTLFLTKRGRIEADINVGTAIINGSVTGNITAAERVLLDSNARVNGQIITPILSVRLGAIFDGECVFTQAPQAPKPANEKRQLEESSESLKHLSAGVAV